MYGTPDQMRGRLEALAAEAQADELMVMTLSHAAEPRLRSYKLLARAFDLK
jgi:alkanesulfonate monooxygenase SsuD/methylene tetrahydromethanopterin reductase-like flavin-dependent oxidoreductase (luciferase family)